MEFSLIILLLTLILLEIVLGVDNLVFIAILADKLPPQHRDKARIIGLSLALVMRIILLSLVFLLVKLTEPLFTVFSHPFSVHDLIMLGGGLFLIFKATVELHERLEGVPAAEHGQREHATLWSVVVQIVILDAVFSLDSVIMAVGLAKEHFWIMVSAVCIAMGAMMFASKPLTKFVNAHPTVVVLCLSFLLMIGATLIAEGFGLHVDKKYVYAAIGFSIMIEIFNQVARRNFLKYQARIPLRERTANTIFNMIGLHGGKHTFTAASETTSGSSAQTGANSPVFGDEERFMIRGILTLADRSIKTIMTPRMDISWIDSEDTPEQIKQALLDSSHSLFPVCQGNLDHVIGVVNAKDLLEAMENGIAVDDMLKQHPPIMVPESIDSLQLLKVLRAAKRRLVLVTDEFGAIQGLITPLDILEAIAGEFPDEDETPDITKQEGEVWLAKGSASLHQLERALGSIDFIQPGEKYATLAGLLLAEYGQIPQEGTVIDIAPYRFEVVEMDKRRIELVRISMLPVVQPDQSD